MSRGLAPCSIPFSTIDCSSVQFSTKQVSQGTGENKKRVKVPVAPKCNPKLCEAKVIIKKDGTTSTLGAVACKHYATQA